MKDLYPPKVQMAIDALLNKPAVSTPTLRRAVVAHAVRLSSGIRESEEIPADLLTYVNKVTMNAYKVTDQDVQHLKAAGYSEDAIFEITLCASLGASPARLERGLQMLKGDE
ncbi:MAG: hypothetical protein L0287_36715 [Anaerolineae bacterium]|nr:hypothetical protein [Anaerolineae bacterium]